MFSPTSNHSDLNSICNALSTRDNTPFSEAGGVSSSSESSSSLPRTPALSTSDLFDLQCCSPSSLGLLLNSDSKPVSLESEMESKRLQEIERLSSEWSTLSDPISCFAWNSTTEPQHRDTLLPSWSQNHHYYSSSSPSDNAHQSGGSNYLSSSHYYSGSPQESLPSSMTRPRSIEHSNLRATGLPFVHSSSNQSESAAPWSGSSSYSASSYSAPSNQTSGSSFSWDAIQARTPVLSGSPVLSPRSSISGVAASEYASSVASSTDSRKRSIDEMESEYQHFQPRSQQSFLNQEFNFALPTTSLSLGSEQQRQARPPLSVWTQSPNATPTAAVFPHRRAHSQARPAPLATHLRTRSFDLPSPTYALLQQQLMGEASSHGHHDNQSHSHHHHHQQAASCTGSPRSAVDWFSLDSIYGPESGTSSSSSSSSHHFNNVGRSQSTSSYQEPRSSAPVSRPTSTTTLDNAAVSSSSSTIGLIKGEKVALEAHTAEALVNAVLQPAPNSKDKPVPYPSVTIHCPNPPASDFESEDVNVRPMRQTGKLKTNDDAYSARWIRYEAQAREAWCSKCDESVPQKWLQLKNSAYGYHTKNVHGVSSHTGRQFAPPIAMKVDAQHMNHGQCFRCQRWVQISSRRNLSWGAWFKHASMCEASAYREKAQANRNSISSNASTASTSTSNTANQLGDLTIGSTSPNSRNKKQRT